MSFFFRRWDIFFLFEGDILSLKRNFFTRNEFYVKAKINGLRNQRIISCRGSRRHRNTIRKPNHADDGKYTPVFLSPSPQKLAMDRQITFVRLYDIGSYWLMVKGEGGSI